MKYFYLLLALVMLPLGVYAQEPALNNQGVCILVVGDGMELNVFGDLQQNSPDLPGTPNRLGGEQGTVLNVTGNITNAIDGAPLFKDGNLLSVYLTGDDQVIQGAGELVGQGPGLINFYTLVLAGTGNKGAFGEVRFTNEIRWETNVDFLTIGNGVFAVDTGVFGEQLDPQLVGETVNARYRDQDGGFLAAIGRLNFDLTARTNYFDELRNLGGSGFYFRQNGVTGFTLNRFHNTEEVAPGKESLPLRYAFTSSSPSPADVGIDYTLTDLSGSDPDDLTLWYLDGAEWVNLGADEVTADFVIKRDIDWSELSNPATFVTAPCPAPTLSLLLPTEQTICQFETSTLAVDDPDGDFTYAWSTGETTRALDVNPTDLSPLEYSVTITDAGKCFSSADVFLSVLPTPGVDIDPTLTTRDTLALCQDAVLTLDPTVVFTDMNNPDAGYEVNYLWSTGETTPTIEFTGDGSGMTDEVILTVSVGFEGGAVGCERSDTLYLRNEALPGFDLGPDQNFCDGTTSTILTTGIADPAGLSIVWTRPDATTFMGPELNATQTGLYTVTINNGTCSVMGSVTLNFSNLTGTGEAVGPVCHPDNFDPGASTSGTLNVSLGGGVGPFQWSVPALGINGESTLRDFSINSFAPEPEIEPGSVYSVQVTDAAGCTITLPGLSFELVAPLAITPIIQDDVCGVGEGFVSLTTSGGTPPYTYNWSNGVSGLNAAAISDVFSGTYAVTVTDVNFCQQFFAGLTVGGPSSGQSLLLNFNFTPINCPGETTVVTLTGSGGNGGLEYSEDGVVYNDVTTYELGSGNYSFFLRDAAGCTIERTLTLLNGFGPAVPLISVIDPILCAGETATIEIQGDPQSQGGEEYSFDNIEFSGDLIRPGLIAGDYRLYVRNFFGCLDSTDFNIPEPAAIVVTEQVITNDDCGLGEGAINLAVTGGTGELTYVWDTPAADAICCPTNLLVGSYNVLITDENSCVLSLQVTVGGAAGALEVESSGATDPSCSDQTDGTITVLLQGGTAPYRYELNGAPAVSFTGNELSLTDLDEGTFDFVFLDASNCTTTTSRTLGSPDPILISLEAVTPSGCENEAVGAIDVTVSGPQDILLSWSDGFQGDDRTDLVAGEYVLTVSRIDAPGCQQTLTVTVPQLPRPTLNLTTTDDLCLADQGILTASATGGAGLLAYDWADGPTGPNRTDLPPGVYTVTVTDENGCTDTASATVNGPDQPLSLGATINNVTCFGAGDGSITANPVGGGGNYTFAWSNGGGNATIADLAPGEYTVTAGDDNGCLVEMTYTVDSPDALTVSAAVTDVAITGSSTGAIDITVSGGTEEYQFFWDRDGTEVGTTEDLTDLPAGIYNLVIIDANGCELDRTYVVSEPSEIELTITEDAFISCADADDGSLSVAATGGDENFTYAWTLDGNPLGDQSTVTDLGPGSYVVTVNDGLGNTATAVYTLEEPATINITVTPINPACADLEDGSISVSVTGGTGDYSYQWEDGSTAPERNNLPAGTYELTVTDERGCEASPAPMPLTAPAALALSAVTQAISAPDATDGSIDLTVAGGAPGYIFNWSNSLTTEDIDNLAPGEYTVTVTDQNACSAEATFTVTGSSALVVSEEITNVSCPEGTDGAIELTVAGGAGNYTFTWGDGSSGFNRENLSAGAYTVTITDDVAGDFTATYTVLDGPEVVFELIVTDADCAGNNNGFISWSSGDNSETLMNLLPGNYSITITNDAGCTVVVDTVITQPDVLFLAASTTPVSVAGGSDGEIDLIVTGGTMPYGYIWAPGGAITEDLTGLPAGTYEVTVTDANFCTAELSVDVPEPGTIVLNGAVTDVRCNGEANGAIDLTASGGFGFLSFTWSDGSDEEDREDLPAGDYRVVVTDLNGVSDSLDFTVEQPEILSLTAMLALPGCPGEANGSLLLTAAGGNGGYTYLWEDSNMNPNLTGLIAGAYTVTLTDERGCQLDAIFTIDDPAPLVLTLAVAAPGCGSSDGIIDLTVTGGTPDYNYVWSTGQISQDLTNIGEGFYAVTVTDENGCLQDTSVNLEPVGTIALSATVTNILCSGTATGEIALSVLPAAGDYSFAWSNGQASATATNLIAGNYAVTVTSADGCTADSLLTIMAPDPLVVNVNTMAAGCTPSVGGSAMALPEGGVLPYTYSWSQGATTAVVDDLASGSYTVTVTDANNCTTTATAVIMEADADLTPNFLAATPVNAEQQIQFVDVSFPAPQAWFWEFNDPAGSTSTEPNPVFTYPDNEEEDLVIYPAMLTASSLFCEDMIIKDITVISLNRRDGPTDPTASAPVYANLEDIALYPNPTPDWAEITVTLNLEADITITLVEAGGRVLTSDKLSGSDRYDWVLDVRSLPSGIYFVRVETEFGLSTRKLVVD